PRKITIELTNEELNYLVASWATSCRDGEFEYVTDVLDIINWEYDSKIDEAMYEELKNLSDLKDCL
ncbi:hypothetical protein OE165_28250, partial [Escherichia coli]|uniref:hypothetical protein n=1 Tax=Escherichia coli TaxID=562 RepID=UPI0021F37A2B